MTTVGMILFPGLTQLDLTGPHEVLARVPGFDVLVISSEGGSVVSENGLVLQSTHAFSHAPPFDVLFVPGGPGVSAAIDDSALLQFVRERGSSARWVTSVCTGALILGAAGLLRGYRATTHWLSLDLLPLYDATPVSERVVVDRNRVTSAGVTAGIDLALVLAAELCGAEAAREIQLMLEYDPVPRFNAGAPQSADAALVDRVRASRRSVQEARREQALRIGADR